MTEHKPLPISCQLQLGLSDHLILGWNETLRNKALCEEELLVSREGSKFIPFVFHPLFVLVLEFCLGKADSCPGLCIWERLFISEAIKHDCNGITDH